MKDRCIVCISANPALDRQLRVPVLTSGEVNRATRAIALPGGKAAHVAMSAHALGAKTFWIGFLGGAIGEECAAELGKLGVEVIAIRTKAATRVNMEIIEDSGRITEVLEPGGTPDESERAELLRVLSYGLRTRWKDALTVISGSLPSGVPSDFYQPLVESARRAGSKAFVDTSGEALRATIAAGPSFVKPNRKEVETLLGQRLEDSAAAAHAIGEIIQRGADSAAITLGADGLVWSEGKGGPVWRARPPRLKAISTVGCGDATLAGFAYASLQGWSGERALRLAAACGAANCLAEFEGRISESDVQSLIPQIDVERLPSGS